MLTRYSARTIVGCLVAVHLAFAPFALTHLDFARDVAGALDIVAGRHFPLEGPVFASAIHFGPVWNYLLAGVLVLAPSWLVVCLALAAIESAKFVLAYKLGETLWNQETGVLWAIGLALPGWTVYAQVLPTHPSLVETLVLAFMLFTVRFHQRGTTGSLVGAAVMCSLALHAHPTTLPIFLLAVPPVILGLRHRTLKWPSLALACGAALAFFIPALYEQLTVGFPDIGGADRYFAANANAGAIATLRTMADIVSGGLVTGPRVVASDLLGWDYAWGTVLATGLVGWVATGFLGVAFNLRNIRHARMLVSALFVTFVAIGFVAVIRPVTPYYFIFSVWPIATGIAAVGLTVLFASPFTTFAPLAVASIALVVTFVIEIRAASQIQGGLVKLAFFPLFDIKQPFARGTRTPFMPAYAMSNTGERYCEAQTATLHGAVAYMALHDYTVAALLACGTPPRLTLGGPAGGNADWLGIAKPMASQLGVTPDLWLGPIAVTHVERSLHPASGYRLPEDRPYPPIAGAYGPTTSITLNVTTQQNEIIVVSNDFFAFTMAPKIRASMDNRPAAPLAEDAISTAFGCEVCAEATQRWQLSIDTPDPRRVDVVTIRRRKRR